MDYTWERAGDQDECIRHICALGPYLLEHTEDHWKGEKLIMASRIYTWNNEEKVYDLIEELPQVEYKRDESYKALEDWYALNVLSEELFIGTVQQEARKT